MSYLFVKSSARHYGTTSNEEKADKASSMFDAAFSTQSSSSMTVDEKEEKSDTARATMWKRSSKKVELPSEAKSTSPSSTSFSSPTASIPDIIADSTEKWDGSDGDESAAGGESTCDTSVGTAVLQTWMSNGEKRVKIVDEKTAKESTNESTKEASPMQVVEGARGDEDSTSRGAFDLEEEEEEEEPAAPSAKRPRFENNQQESASIEGNSAGGHESFSIFKNKEAKPVYKHKWASDEEEEEEDVLSVPVESPKADTSKIVEMLVGQRVPRYDGARERAREPESGVDAVRTRVRNVKEALKCKESGEHDDYKQDIEYALTTLLDTSATNYVKCLSIMALARKCVTREFRTFFRTQEFFVKFAKALLDCPSTSSVSVCVATVVYLMARDTVSIPVNMTTLRLLVQLVMNTEKPEKKKNPEYDKCVKMAWAVFDEYVEKYSAHSGVGLQFDFTKESFSASSVALEAMVYVCFRNRSNELVKNELHGLGILQWIVSTVDKSILSLTYDLLEDDGMLVRIYELERCFRILEMATVMHKKNQAFLISHRSNLLIRSCGKLIGFFHELIDGMGATDSKLLRRSFVCLTQMLRVLMNLSHENELCSSRLGQLTGCLALLMATCTYLAPKYCDEDSRFDIIVITSSLLVNLLERCNLNRRLLINMRVKLYNREKDTVSDQPVLTALCLMFLYHDSVARIVDEDLDNDLVIEDPSEESDHEDEGEGEIERSRRMALELTEDEMAQSIEKVMNKASRHMEDSMVSSYVALLVGCLLQQNEESVSVVKAVMPDGKLAPMVEQLQRFLDFMKITHSHQSSRRSLEKIIDLLDKLNDKH